MPKRESSDAQRAAVARYDEKHDRINCRLPKGTADAIRATGASVNSFIIDAVKEKLEKDTRKKQESP